MLGSEKFNFLTCELRSSKTCPSLTVSGDCGKIIENAVSSAFKDAGFKTGEKGYYSAKIEIDNAVSGNDPLSITPSVKVELLGNSKKSVYSYIFKSQEKTVSYALETAQKKAFPKIAEKINEEKTVRLVNKYF